MDSCYLVYALCKYFILFDFTVGLVVEAVAMALCTAPSVGSNQFKSYLCSLCPFDGCL